MRQVTNAFWILNIFLTHSTLLIQKYVHIYFFLNFFCCFFFLVLFLLLLDCVCVDTVLLSPAQCCKKKKKMYLMICNNTRKKANEVLLSLSASLFSFFFHSARVYSCVWKKKTKNLFFCTFSPS